MGDSNKIKPLSKKLAASLIKNETLNGLEKSVIFDTKTRAEMFMDIEDDQRLKLLKQIDTEKNWKFLKRKIQQLYRKTFRLWSCRVAASVVLLISISFVFKKRNQDKNFKTPILVNNNIDIGTDKATLTLDDGSNITLEKGTAYQMRNITSNEEEIIYIPAGQACKAANYQQPVTNNHNALAIPRGDQFNIALSVGTKVWLNSESQLKYPVAFNEGETRLVKLVYGEEVYFDVLPSTDYPPAGWVGKDLKFKMFNQSQEVEVFGAEFNIKTYKDEINISTTLVEGKMAVNYLSRIMTLVPNQQLNLNLGTNRISLTEVDVYNEIVWKNCVFSFEYMPLKNIMKVLSSWYGIEGIIQNNVQKEDVFNKISHIKDVLIVVQNTHFITNYEINNKTLTIK